jgi:hypothetical protein
MTDKTIPEIKEEFANSGTSILNEHNETLAEIAAETEPEPGRYADRLGGQERMALMREQKTARSQELRSRTLEAYLEEVERYHTELSSRADYLRGRLFKVEDAGALSRAALATDTELGTLLDLAARAGNAELGRAVFAASEQRGLGDLMAQFFDRMDPEARDLYNEFREIPPPQILERQRENAELIIPPANPDRLTAYARATT